MPAISKLRSKNGSHLIASWQLLSKQFSGRAFQRYGFAILAGIGTVWSRHRASFDWQQVAAILHISGTVADNNFCSELMRTATNRMQHQIAPQPIEEPQAQNTSKVSNSKASQ